MPEVLIVSISTEQDNVTPLLKSRGFWLRTVSNLDDARSVSLKGFYPAAVVLLEGVDNAEAIIDSIEGIAVRAPHMRFVVVYDGPRLRSTSNAVTLLPTPPHTQTLLDTVESLLPSASNQSKGKPHYQGTETLPPVLIGESAAMKQMFDELRQVAPTSATVLLTGETGTGKELVAQAIHGLYRTNGEPFVSLHCSSLPQTLLESELFGHVRGSFTGAVANRRGAFESADSGTLFLDEVATITPEAQVKLLRVLQDRTVQRVGASKATPTDFRLVAATNRDLGAEVRAGRFREDLFYRINVFPIEIPPLRERPEDIPILADHFCRRFAKLHDTDVPELPNETIAAMQEYEWPGNVRELQSYLERAVIVGRGGTPIPFDKAALSHARAERYEVAATARQHRWPLARLEREHILNVLDDLNGHQTKAAAVLGISRRTLSRKLKQYRAANSGWP